MCILTHVEQDYLLYTCMVERLLHILEGLLVEVLTLVLFVALDPWMRECLFSREALVDVLYDETLKEFFCVG